MKTGIAVAYRIVRSIPGDAAVISGGGVALSVGNIPSVRQVHVRPGRIIEVGRLRPRDILLDELPPCVQDIVHPQTGRRSVNLGAQGRAVKAKGKQGKPSGHSSLHHGYALNYS